MSVYLSIDGGEGIELASNTGWGDVCRAVDRQSATPAFGRLVNEGMIDGETVRLRDDINVLLGGVIPDTVRATLTTLKQNLMGVSDDAVIGVV